LKQPNSVARLNKATRATYPLTNTCVSQIPVARASEKRLFDSGSKRVGLVGVQPVSSLFDRYDMRRWKKPTNHTVMFRLYEIRVPADDEPGCSVVCQASGGFGKVLDIFERIGNVLES
jgi:hypothetical protein